MDAEKFRHLANAATDLTTVLAEMAEGSRSVSDSQIKELQIAIRKLLINQRVTIPAPPPSVVYTHTAEEWDHELQDRRYDESEDE